MSLVLAPIQVHRFSWDWTRTCVVGIVNVTPDSFYDGGRYQLAETAVDHGLRLAAQGADLIDVGGESTRPGAEPVSADEERARVLPVIGELARRSEVALSVDTVKAEVARAAVQAGASCINDVSGLRLDEGMAAVAAETGALLVLGHLRGTPATMNEQVEFADVVREVIEELRESVRRAVRAGVAPDRILVDPGLGFGKRPEHSLLLLRSVGQLREALGYPVMVGPSRKGFIGAVTGKPVEERLMGSASAVAAAIVAGADAVRVHDPGELLPAIKVADAIRGRRPGAGAEAR
jgi:dihydropteroate synthase